MSKLLVGYDGSAPSRRAVDHAAALARMQDHEIVLLTVIPAQVRGSSLNSMMPAGLALPQPMSRTFEEGARSRLEELAAQLSASGVKVSAQVRAGETVEELIRLAGELRVSEIVIGHKSFEGAHVPVGPNAQQIVERAQVRVTLVP